MNLESIRTALYTWMERETGITIIFAEQSTVRPDFPYGSIKYTHAAERTGIDEVRYNGSDEYLQVGDRKALCSLNIFGEEANAKMASLLDTLHRPSVIEEFTNAEIVATVQSGPVDLTYLEDESYVERSQMDIMISFTMSRDAEVVPIESVEGEGTAGDLQIDFDVDL